MIKNAYINNKKPTNCNNSLNYKYNNYNIFEIHINITKKHQDFNIYIYECFTKELEFSIHQGTKNAKINLKLYSWPKSKSFFICDSHLSDKLQKKLNMNHKILVITVMFLYILMIKKN